MTEYSHFNIVYRLQRWMDSVPGQTFLNYAYSWGAAIVILGTLFKLTHLPGANLMLFLGMGTEVVVFFLSAFDRPFDKTADGRDIPTHVTEEYLEGVDVGTAKTVSTMQKVQAVKHSAQPIAMVSEARNDADAPAQTVQSAPAGGQPSGESTSNVGPIWADAEVAEATNRYIEELKKLTETLEKVSEQSSRLTRDSEEMENLNRTLTGITKVYEMQLKGASQQIGTIDQINDQTKKMAQQIEQLNTIYARMIEAMTVNMKMQNP